MKHIPIEEILRFFIQEEEKSYPDNHYFRERFQWKVSEVANGYLFGCFDPTATVHMNRLGMVDYELMSRSPIIYYLKVRGGEIDFQVLKHRYFQYHVCHKKFIQHLKKIADLGILPKQLESFYKKHRLRMIFGS